MSAVTMPSELTIRLAGPGIVGEAYGVRVSVAADTQALLEQMMERLPPGWRETQLQEDDPRFVLSSSEDGLEYTLRRDGQILTEAELDVALGVFDAQLRGYIALYAPDRIFVHAGVVAHNGKAIVIPGRSFSGKTTLVAALVRAGATYFSDEYAVLDEEGRVHPYPKPLSLRLQEGSRLQTDHHVDELGGLAGDQALPVGLIVAAQYRSGAIWSPTELTGGDAALELMANTIPAQERPQQALVAIRRAVEGAITLKGERGDASDLVPLLLERAEQ